MAQELLLKYNATQLVEIPKGFSANVTAYKEGGLTSKATVNVYWVFSATMLKDVSFQLIDSAILTFNRDVAPDVVRAEKSTIIKGRVHEGVDPAQISGLMISQMIVMPVTIIALFAYCMQVVATSVAMEKEGKTLETLLTLPMDRLAILAGKLFSSTLIASIGALAYMVGFTCYVIPAKAQLPTGASIDLAALGLTPSALGYLLMGTSLLVTLLLALALAVVISAFAEDVRSAQSLLGWVYPLVFAPAFVLMFLDIDVLPFALKAIIYAIPYSHPIIASRAVMMDDYSTAALGIAYVTALTLIIMYIASRLFATEKLLETRLRLRAIRGR